MNLSSPIESLIPGLRGRVLTAMVRSPRPQSLRELTRRARSTSPSSVKLVLGDLIAVGIVRYALVSKSSQFFELNESHILTGHLRGIDAVKDMVVEVLRNHADSWPRPPRAVVLFGSVARAEDTAASDIDLLIVWKSDKAPSDGWNADKLRLVEAIYGLTGNSLNIVDLSASGWKEALASNEPLVVDVARDGISVLGTATRTLTSSSSRSADQ